jgi:Rieske Fe-S protein
MTHRGHDPLTRRHVLGGAAVAGLGGPLLASCGGSEEPQDSGGAQDSSTTSGPTIHCPCHGSTFSAVDGSVLDGPAANALASEQVTVKGQDLEVEGAVVGTTSEVPEGGGTVFREQKVVVTQPEAGDFKAFTAVCTHQGCLVDRVESA